MNVRLFATGSFVIAGLVLLAVALFTSNTANILAWGILESIGPIANDRGVLFVFEAVHTSPALVALALGCWCAMLLPLFDVYRSGAPEIAIPRFYVTLVVVLVVFLSIAISCNLRLMHYPGDEWRDFWAWTMWDRPSDFPWLPYWIPVLPLPVMVLASFWLWRKIGAWTVVASLLALPLLMFPLVLRNYLAHHYLCYSILEVYSTTLTLVSPLLFAVPIILVYIAGRKAKRESQSDGM